MPESKESLSVGIIMPISPIDNCSADHWSDVRNIITEAIESISEYECTAKIVSDADDVGVIQKRIVQNIYSSDVIVCDVSCKNANVMFELGMRLAFDKPTVIIKDDITSYSFDTQIIEHLGYPRDLRFSRIVDFKKNLANKIVSTYKSSLNDPEHSTFLKNFGTFKVAAVQEAAVPRDDLLIDMLSELHSEVSGIKSQLKNPNKLKLNNSADNSNLNLSTVALDREVSILVNEFIKDCKISDDGTISTEELNDLTNYISKHTRVILGTPAPEFITTHIINRVLTQRRIKIA
ncbi:hypothetical protein ABEW50_22035 [Paenibacillus jamilae]